METTYTHPSPLLNRIVHYGAAVLSLVMLLMAFVTFVMAFRLPNAGISLLIGVIILLLIPFVLMLTASTPPVTLSDTGIHISPLVWKAQFVPWEAVQSMKPYPLLPQPSAETERRALVGRKRYRPAEGVILLIPSLPLQYRITGFLAGEGLTPVIALTSRSHRDYPALLKQLQTYLG